MAAALKSGTLLTLSRYRTTIIDTVQRLGGSSKRTHTRPTDRTASLSCSHTRASEKKRQGAAAAGKSSPSMVSRPPHQCWTLVSESIALVPLA